MDMEGETSELSRVLAFVEFKKKKIIGKGVCICSALSATAQGGASEFIPVFLGLAQPQV